MGGCCPLGWKYSGHLWLQLGAPEPLYDDFILREIAAEGEEFQEAKVIGRVIGKYQVGISDSWAAYRIEAMIREGKLKVVSAVAEDMPVYHRVLKKCSYHYEHAGH